MSAIKVRRTVIRAPIKRILNDHISRGLCLSQRLAESVYGLKRKATGETPLQHSLQRVIVRVQAIIVFRNRSITEIGSYRVRLYSTFVDSRVKLISGRRTRK